MNARGSYQTLQEDYDDKEVEALEVSASNIFHHECPDDITIVAILKACAKQRNLRNGQKLHALVVKNGSSTGNAFMGNTLVNMYAKCGALSRAQQVFQELLVRDVVSWTVLIAGFAQSGNSKGALDCYGRMQFDGCRPNAVTFTSILKACGSLGEVVKGKEVHSDIITRGLLKQNTVLGSALVDMYVKCGVVEKAKEVFDMLPSRNVISWTALLAGYCEPNKGQEALNCFERMKDEGFPPNAVTFACILKACGNVASIDKGKRMHGDILRGGLLDGDTVLGNSLVDMYAKCGALSKAQQVFDDLPVWDVVSWNALITGYAQHGHGQQALECFEHMLCKGFPPNEVTFTSMLKACGSMGAGEKGKEIHAEISRQGAFETSHVLRNAVVSMYVNCGVIAKARQVFDEMSVRDVFSWNVLITGYCEREHGDEALECYEGMKREGLYPDAVTFACILKSCGSTGAAKKGNEIHTEVVRKGLLGRHTMIGNAIVDMYAKCGALVKAQEVFDELPCRNVISWTSLISGYSEHGHGEEALTHFGRMETEGLYPDAVTFACVLKACSSIEATEKGQMLFQNMHTSYGILPNLKHHTCVVYLFGRTGHFEEAMAVIKKTPSSDYLVAWFALLSACRKRGNLKLGSVAFENAVGEFL